MDLFFDDISQLVRETFDNVYGSESDLSCNKELCECAGIFYRVEKKLSVFVIRAFASRNLKKDFESSEIREEVCNKLRIENTEDQNQISHFVCDDYFIAKNIVRSLANRRFAKEEENLFNVSDPGDSWWLDIDQEKFSLHFKLANTHRIDKLIKLGPIGEIDLSFKVLRELKPYFSKLFGLKHYSCHSGCVEMIPFDHKDPIYLEVINLFKNGEVSPSLLKTLRNLELSSSEGVTNNLSMKANYFLLELASFRSFWLNVESCL